MTEFNKWVALKATPLLFVSLAMFFAPILRAEATAIKDLRIGNNSRYVRMVLEFDQPLIPPASLSLNRNTLQVTLTGIINNLPPPQTREYLGDIVRLDVTRTSEARRIDVVFSFDPVDIKTFSLTGPHRFIIDAYRPVSSVKTNLSIEDKTRQTQPIEEYVISPEPNNPQVDPARTGLTAFIDKVSMKVQGSVSPNGSNTDDLNKNGFHQRLIAALIVVTTIIVVLLFFLIWAGRSRKKSREPSWTHRLPPAKDQDIESIDSEIREYLKSNDHL